MVAFFFKFFYRNLMGNPLNCNCHMSWLPEWLNSRSVFTGDPICQSPENLRDVPLAGLQKADFTCDSKILQYSHQHESHLNRS